MRTYAPMRRALCDGCNVNEPFEHRCHGAFGPITVRGESLDAGCSCSECIAERDEVLGGGVPDFPETVWWPS